MNIKQQVEDYYQLLSQGKVVEAGEKYFSQDVELVEMTMGGTTKGYQACIEKEKAFAGGITEIRDFTFVDYVISGDKVFDISTMDITHSQMGDVKAKQVAVTTWKDGKIVKQEFYGHTA